jgi:hypothetical protein
MMDDIDGINWNNDCGIADLTFTGLPSFVTIVPDGSYTLEIYPNLPSHVGNYKFTVTKKDRNKLIPDLEQDLSFEVIYIPPPIEPSGEYTIDIGTPPTWNFESSEFYLDPEDSSSLNARIFPLNHVTDADEGDIISLTVSLGQASVVFGYDEVTKAIEVK